LPPRLGALADALHAARSSLRARWPDGATRRRALDAALAPGGALDPWREHADDAVARWIDGAVPNATGRHVIVLAGADPDDLTLRQARLLGHADALVAGPDIPPAILSRARADALRLGPGDPEPDGIVVELRI
jgi:uroporphyrin-III C-methyltransferase/precorrin-2 dehydrogenase/sirohydrochlorin ferrochelatase